MTVLKNLKIFSYKIADFIKYFLCFFCVVLSIFFINLSPVKATSQLDQSQPLAPNILYYANFQVVAQMIAPTHDNISGIDINMHTGNGQYSASSTLTLCKGDPQPTGAPGAEMQANITATAPVCGWSGNELLATISPAEPTTTDGDLYNFTFPTPIPIDDIGGDYYFVLVFGDAINYYEPTYSPSYGGMLVNDNARSASLTFNTYYDDAYVPPILWSITPIKPLSNAVIASSTTDFIVNYSKPTTEEDYINFTVYDNGDNKIFDDTINIYTVAGSPAWSLNLPDGLYSWSASIYCISYYWNACDNTNIATDIQYFKVSRNFIDPDKICEGIATSTGITDLHIDGDINCGARKAFYWAFYPGNGSLNSLENSYTSLKKAFPFSAFFGLTDALDTGIASTTLNATGTLQMPFINTSGHYVMITVLNASSTPNLIGQTNATLFRNSIKWFLWLAVAFIIFLTFKKI